MANMRVLVSCVLLVLAVSLWADAAPADSDDYDDAVEIGLSAVGAGPDREEDDAACALPPKRGRCRALFIRWHYDAATKQCYEFKYGGCDGNGNNFPTKKHCLRTCAGA